MKKNAFVFVTWLISIFTLSCKESPSENNNKIKTPLEMTWTVDTLAYPESAQTLMTQFCAFVPNDIYIVGWCSYVGGEMYHYDGKSWSPVNVVKDIGGHRINRLYGFSPNNIWGAGYEGEHNLLVHYNGIKWENIGLTTQGNLLAIDADSPNNIYAVGKNGVIYHYDGNKWIYEKFIPKLLDNTSFQYYSVAVYNSETFILGLGINNGFSKKYIIKGKIGSWGIVDSVDMTEPNLKVKWGIDAFEKGGNGKLYSYGYNNFFVYENGLWKLLPTPNEGNRGIGFYVRESNYMISLGNNVDFFDGVSWRSLTPKLNNNNLVFFRDAWSNGEELFLIATKDGQFPQKTIVYHGR